MKLSNMLAKEAVGIANNDTVGKRNDCTELLISARFGSDHLHHILPPNQGVVDQVVEDLLSYTSEEFNKSLTVGSEKGEDKDVAPEEVIFHNRQAFGDILMMTCAIRDFKASFPKTRTSFW